MASADTQKNPAIVKTQINNNGNVEEYSILANTDALEDYFILQGSKYQITRQLGQGGFGISYEGMQVGLRRRVAIKEFYMKGHCQRETSMSVITTRPGDMELIETFKSKFLKEARILARLEHPNIVKIIDVFEENNTVYYVMEYLEGLSLQRYVEEHGPLSEKDALLLIRQVAAALDYIHQNRILHLDIKPDNIMLKDDKTPVLIDFGISKHFDEQGKQTSYSPTGISRGYAPEEQYVRGGINIFAPAVDIYSLGATLLFMLTGECPPESLYLRINGMPPFPDHISTPTRTAITQAMQPSMTDRPQSIAEFLKMLDGEKVKTVHPQPTVDPIKEESEAKTFLMSFIKVLSNITLFATLWMSLTIIFCATFDKIAYNDTLFASNNTEGYEIEMSGENNEVVHLQKPDGSTVLITEHAAYNFEFLTKHIIKGCENGDDYDECSFYDLDGNKVANLQTWAYQQSMNNKDIIICLISCLLLSIVLYIPVYRRLRDKNKLHIYCVAAVGQTITWGVFSCAWIILFYDFFYSDDTGTFISMAITFIISLLAFIPFFKLVCRQYLSDYLR